MKIPQNRQYVMFGGTFVLANKLQAVADKTIDGLSTKQWFLLRSLSDLPLSPAPTITELAHETDTSRQNVSKLLTALQRQGYVTLTVCEDDHRSQRVMLTEQGGQILQKTATASAPFFTELFDGISEAECAAAASVIIKLIDNLNKMQEEMA